MNTQQSQIKPYKQILQMESTLTVLDQRKFLGVKILCTSGATRRNYQECIDSIDSTLYMIFDAIYKDMPEDERIDDLLAFTDEIDQLSR